MHDWLLFKNVIALQKHFIDTALRFGIFSLTKSVKSKNKVDIEDSKNNSNE